MNCRIGTLFVLVLMPAISVVSVGCGAAESSRVRWMESESTSPPTDICKALMQNFLDANSDLKLEYVEYERVAGTRDWYIARADWHYGWEGGYSIFRWNGGRIVSHAQFPDDTDMYFGQSIDEVGSLRMPQFNGPVVRIVDMTHTGNRYLQLAELDTETGTLRLLCKARITLPGGDEEYNLSQAVKDVDGDGCPDIVLEGTLKAFDKDKNMDVKSPVRKVLLYKPEEKAFRLSIEDSVGVNPDWDDRDSGFNKATVSSR